MCIKLWHFAALMLKSEFEKMPFLPKFQINIYLAECVSYEKFQ